MRTTTTAAVLALLAGVILHAYDCAIGTHEQCLMSRGSLWLYVVVMFLFFLSVITAIRSTIQYLNNEHQ